jgi:RNA polymerase sigma-70 factor (ECF subfamily)
MMAVAATSLLPQAPRSDWELTVARDQAEPASAADLADLDEPALVQAALSGVPGAFDLIVERHRRGVYQLCYRFVNNHEDAADLTQDVFLKAYRGLRNFKGQAALGTWLYRIGVNACLNKVSAKRPAGEPLDSHQLIDEQSESASERVLRDERAVAVRAAVGRLPKKQRAVLVMRMFQEMSHQEIAASLNTSVGAVKANVFHALQNLKKMLSQGNR